MTDPFDSFDIDINDDTNDSGSVAETAVKEAVKAVEEQTEPPKTEVPATEEPEPQDNPTTSQEDDFSGYSNAALLALSYQKDGLFPEDAEISKDLSPEKLKEMLLDAALKMKDEDREKLVQDAEQEAQRRLSEKGMTDEHLTYIQQIMNGADPQIVSKVAQFRSWAEAELEGEEDMEAVVRAGLRLQLSNNPNADDLIEAYMEKNVTGKGTDTLQEQAAKFQDYIGKVADHLEAEDNKRVEAQKAQALQAEQKFAEEAKRQIEQGVFGITWKKAEQNKLHDYMTKKDVVVEINGRKQKVTQEVADRIRDQSDYSKRVFEAYQRMTGYTKLANAAHQTATDKFLKSIKSESEPKSRPIVSLPTATAEADFEIEI